MLNLSELNEDQPCNPYLFQVSDMSSPHVCGCDGKSGSSSHRQTLDEVDFERGIWAAARDGDTERVAHLLTR